jgi:hypothetical protein
MRKLMIATAATLALGRLSTSAAMANCPLSYLSKESGFSAEQIQTWEKVSDKIGSTSQEFDEFLSDFTTHMQQMRNWVGPINYFFSSQMNPEIRAFGQALHYTKSNVQAFELILNFLESKRYDITGKSYLTRAVGLPKVFAYAGDHLRDLYREGGVSDQRIEDGRDCY